jgi:hypothetical protein
MTPAQTEASPRRRPQWRGEREAILVRLPAELAGSLRREAQRRQQSVSDTAAGFIAQQLNEAR